MAEAFGIAAGAVGFVSLLVQITSGINKLRAITNSAEAAPDEIQSVIRELDFLVHVMQEANDKAPSQIDPLLQHCQTSCDQVVRDLDALNKILETGSKRNAKGKVSRILVFRHWKENVEDLRRDIQGAKLNLIITERTSRHFWALEYTPLAIFRQTCDKKSCNVVKYGGTFRFALSQLGIRWATVVQLYIVTTSGRYSLRPSIEVERVVPYTSPGFEILWKLRNRMISFEDGREELVHLRRTDPTFPNHVDPSGKSYIENLLMAPARWPVEREYRYKLLKLFMGEFGMTRGTETSTFLSNCAHWIGEAPHLELLEILLDLGFNAAEINIHHWPEPCSPDWFAPDIAADPFFVEYLRLLWFAEMSPLHEAVLFDSLESVRKWISRLKKDERNAFGQTSLHLAISKPDYLRILIDAGYDLDARDNYGITPLMYAAGTNQEEAVMMLIEANSDLDAADLKWSRNFMFYAGLRKHWNLILKILNTIESHVGKHAAERWAKFATYLFLVIFPDHPEVSGVSLGQLLAKCGTVNFIYDAGNGKRNRCLLHDIRSPAEFEALLANGFRLVNHADSAGQHPVMAAADRCDSVLVRRLLAHGTDINRKDNFHKTSLYYVLRRLEARFTHHSLVRALETLRILLENDSDVLTRDACRCPCSPQGCLPTATLQHNSQGLWRKCVPLWSLEWLSLISEHRGESEAKITLLSFIRRAKHGEMGMTHVCCQREQSYLFLNFSDKALPDEDIDEIIDEECAFIEDLESEMDQSARKEYNALLNDWIVQIKTSLDRTCIEAAKEGKEYGVVRPNWKVDHHRDTFVYEIETWRWRDPKKEVTSQISEPRCPQVAVDVGHLLRIPPDHTFPDEPEDEFKCTNLDVVLPDSGPDVRNSNLPVLVWIHGGSQAVTFGSAASGVCDMSKIVADSLRLGKPIIAVSVQYRLNVFALGNREGPPNLALRDQELALQWVQDHIAGFGGDPDMITLAGESAGAIYCHAHLVANARVRQVILSSGSLFLSSPQPWHLVASFRDKVSTNLKDMDQTLDLETASASEVVEAVRRSGLQSFFLEWEDPFNAWHTKTGCAERLLLSDVTKEGAIYQAGVWATDPSDIAKAFDASEQYGDELKKLYHIYRDRPSSCKTGALDFINDYKYLLPVERLEKSFKGAKKPVFRCLIDEANPWQPSSGAHHAVDLVLLFAGFDLSFAPSAERVGQAMREAWIKFISGEEPWPDATDKYYGFGPHGTLKTLEDWEVQSRRRVGLAEKLSEMESSLLDKTSSRLAAGKVSLLN
ncbi:hypothetical protein LZL87_009159 [Fusarium oxysporum]|nr:hypothetical protein LZL87_009159 [Fusarium oxysporum]